MAAVVGFDRKIKREWLDALADRVAQDQDAATLRLYLHEILKEEHPGDTARGKTVTVLMRIWALVPEEHHHLREQAFDLLKSISASDRIWLHWGMCLMAYPLFHDMAAAAGRLLKLQDDFTWGQIHRRLIDGWGERTTVKKAVPRLVRSMADWNTLAESEERGHFQAMPLLTTKSKPLQLWLLRASHIAEGNEMIEATQLLSLPSCFPFKITAGKTDVRRCKDFDVHRQGLDMDMVSISNNVAPKKKAAKGKKKKKKGDSRQPLLFDDD